VNPLLAFLKEVFAYNGDLWASFTAAFTAQSRILAHTPAILIYRAQPLQAATVRQLLYSTPHKVWGLTPMCGGPSCNSTAGSIRISITKRGDGNHHFAKYSCIKCKWESRYAARPRWLAEVPGRQFYFYHNFPLTLEQQKHVILAPETQVDQKAHKRARK